MPVDYKRFNGPDNSVSYKCYTKQYLKTFQELFEDLFCEGKLRADKRRPNDPKQMYLKPGILSQAKGSAYLELGNTKVVCAVFEPRETPHQNEFSVTGQLHCELKLAAFSCWRARLPPAPSDEERALADAVRRALQPALYTQAFPNLQLDIFIYILEHDGCCLAAAINAAGVALADAAMPMYDLVAACTLAVRGDRVLVDPTEKEEHVCLYNKAPKDAHHDESHGILVLTMLLSIGQVADIYQIGSMDYDLIESYIETLKGHCQTTLEQIQFCLAESVEFHSKVEQTKDELSKEKRQRIQDELKAIEIYKKVLEDSKKAKADAIKAMEDSKKAMEDSKKAKKDAIKAKEDAKKAMEDSKNAMEDSEEAMEHSKKAKEDPKKAKGYSKKAMEDSKKDMEDSKKDMEDSKKSTEKEIET